MNTNEILNLTKSPLEDYYSKKIKKWFIAEDVLMEQFEEIEEEGALPDLLGKNILVTRNQFPKIYSIVKDIAKALEMPIPQAYVYDNYKCVIDSEGIRIPRLEISARLVKEFKNNELIHVIAKEMYHIKFGHIYYEVMAEKTMSLLTSLPNIPGINILKQFGSDFAAQGTNFHFQAISFKWFTQACFSAENFAIAYTNDIGSSISATLLGIFNERELAQSININDYLGQIAKIELCIGPAATLERINEVIPYGPYRIDNMIKFVLTDNGRSLFNYFGENI